MNTISSNNLVYKFDKDTIPVYFMESGESVCLEIKNVFSLNDKLNIPINGPIYINNANKNDALKITVEKITIEEKKINPYIGTVGLAPKGSPISTLKVSNHGGNINCSLIGEGSIIYLPIFIDGGLLSLGNLLCNKDNEIYSLSGIIQIKVQIIKEFSIRTPFIVNEDFINFIHFRKTLMLDNKYIEENILKFLSIDYKKEINEVKEEIKIIKCNEDSKINILTIPKKYIKKNIL